MSTLAGLGHGCFVRPSRAGQCVDTLIRTNSLTRRDQGKGDLISFSELCPSWNKSDTMCLLGINTQTFAVICNSAIWAVSLCVSAHRHRVPFLGIQPSNVLSIGSLGHMAALGVIYKWSSATSMKQKLGQVRTAFPLGRSTPLFCARWTCNIVSIGYSSFWNADSVNGSDLVNENAHKAKPNRSSKNYRMMATALQ